MEQWNFLLFLVAVFLATTSFRELSANAIEIPDECKSKGFCSIKPVGYEELEEKMNNLLPKHLIQDFEQRILQNKTPRRTLVNDQTNCPYYVEEIQGYTYTPNGENNTNELIVQTNLLKQIITIAECATDHIQKGDAECFPDILTPAVKKTCENTYAYRPIYVYDLKKENLIKKLFPVSVCCSCVIRNRFLNIGWL